MYLQGQNVNVLTFKTFLLLEQRIHLGLHAAERCSLQLVQGGHVLRAAAVSEVVEVLDEHPHDLESVRHRDGQLGAGQTRPGAAGSAGELSEPHTGEDVEQRLGPPGTVGRGLGGDGRGRRSGHCINKK